MSKLQETMKEMIKEPVGGKDGAALRPVTLAPIARLLFTPKEAAAALGISPRLLCTQTKSGGIPCVRIGKAVRYSPAALQAWIDEASVS